MLNRTHNRPAPADNHDPAYTHRVLAVFACDGTESLWWRVDGSYAPITFFAQVSDVFQWGAADTERIDPADVPLLEKAADDARRIKDGDPWIAELYAARKRGMRPQGAFYEHIPQALHAAFDSCGPRRLTQWGNPVEQPPGARTAASATGSL